MQGACTCIIQMCLLLALNVFCAGDKPVLCWSKMCFVLERNMFCAGEKHVLCWREACFFCWRLACFVQLINAFIAGNEVFNTGGKHF